MASPHLYLDNRDILRICENLNQYGWYRQAFDKLKANCDQMLRKGFFVPETCGFVFYNSCKSDNTLLIFDPYDPENHVCPTCGMNYQDPPFHRAWQCYYHQWLAQMTIQLGIVYSVTKDSSYAAAVRKMLIDYVRRYPSYENNDNELGTTKVFQSTYIESVWLSYLTCGYDLTNADSCYSEEDRQLILRELFRPSAAVIRDYDEKWNNRQAFNNSGMCAAAILTEDEELLRYVLYGEHGFAAHMEHSVLQDGLWYEGDNYHFATVPSLVNIAEMCLHNGLDLYHKRFGGHSIADMFLAPLQSLQPDFTFPSRKDSPYASQIAQRWYSGLYELAHARYPEEEAFGRILKVMYARQLPENGDYKNAAGLMDIFTSVPASRSDLDWRGFMAMAPDLGKMDGVPVTTSVNMKGTGLAVLRQQQQGNHYLSLDYGDYGGGHGHPDRLAVTWFANGRRWLCDYGTGQYYFDHLNWYRSTIGHNTLGIDGRQQSMINGSCKIFGETPVCSAARGECTGLIPGVNASRTVLLLENGLFLDWMHGESGQPHTYRNVFHSFGLLRLEGKAEPAQLEGEAYRFLRNVRGYQTSQPDTAVFDTNQASFYFRTAGGEPMAVYAAEAYGPPNAIPQLFPMYIAEKCGCSADFYHLLEDVPAGACSVVTCFEKTPGGCRIQLTDGTEFIVGLVDGISVCRYQDGKLTAFSGFGCRNIAGICKTELTCDTIYGEKTPDGWKIRTGEHFGQLETGELLCGEPVFCNGELIPALYREGILWEKPLADALVAGIPNQIPVELGNFTDQSAEIQLTRENTLFPYGLELETPVTLLLEPGCRKTEPLRLVPGGENNETSRWQFALQEALSLREEPAYGRQNALVCVYARNTTLLPLEVAFSFGKTVVIAPDEELLFRLDEADVSISGQWLELEYTAVLAASGKVFRRCFRKALVSPAWTERQIPLDCPAFLPNLYLSGPEFVARNERHWTGEEDLSAEGMLTVSGEKSLTLRLKVKDDTVLFSGGKFPFDNDCVQLCFSRPGEDNARKVSRVLFFGSVSDEACKVQAVENIAHPEEISLSIHTVPDGYALLADIPFTCLGGAPEKGELWGFDLLVNDRDSGVRRDLQLIWSGAQPGERLYLREDHHNADRFGLIRF